MENYSALTQANDTHIANDTIAAIATPPGEGGIAIVRLSGPDALQVAAAIFRNRRGRNLASLPGYSVRYGRFVAPESGEVVDDGLATIFRAPRSYTGEDTVELSCHGGRVVTERVLRLTLDAGARLAAPGEFTQRAFFNGRLDLAQAEAVADVIRARNQTAQRMARRQLEGALSQAVGALKEELIGVLAAIEVTIDFSDEAGDLNYDETTARLNGVARGVNDLLATAESGRILREGLRVALVGRPNVGKSSLLNALLRVERAIVTPLAGTTRDVLEESANIGGASVVLLDTAGLRETGDLAERIGVARAQAAASGADVVALVLDATTGVTEEDREIARRLAAKEAPEDAAHGANGRLLAIFNKGDLAPSDFSPADFAREGANMERQGRDSSPLAGAVWLTVSARTGEGLDVLRAELARRAGGTGGDAAESVVVTSARHRQALEAARDSLQNALATTTQRLPGDFIAIDARGALDALGLITGETVTDDIIHRIFHDFCVGK